MFEFAPICIYLVTSLLVSLILLGVSFLFSSNSSTYPKNFSAYECGFDPFGDARSCFDIRFYIVSVLFIIFDLEVTFCFPWAVSLNKIDQFGFWSMMVFLLILTIGFLYEWKRGALDLEFALSWGRRSFHILLRLLFFFLVFLFFRPFVRLAVSFFYLYLFSKVLDTWSFHILSGAQLAFNSSSNTSLEWSGTLSSSTAQGPADVEATVPAEVPAQAQLLAALSPLQREALAQIADGEIELFARIRLLEAELSYRLPPQLNAGEYEQLSFARIHFYCLELPFCRAESVVRRPSNGAKGGVTRMSF